MEMEGINNGKTQKSASNSARANNRKNRLGLSGTIKEHSRPKGNIKSNQSNTERTIEGTNSTRPRPKTSGGIVRQLILQTENQLAQKKTDIEFLESQLEQFREMLSEWEAGVFAIEPDSDTK